MEKQNSSEFHSEMQYQAQHDPLQLSLENQLQNQQRLPIDVEMAQIAKGMDGGQFRSDMVFNLIKPRWNSLVHRHVPWRGPRKLPTYVYKRGTKRFSHIPKIADADPKVVWFLVTNGIDLPAFRRALERTTPFTKIPHAVAEHIDDPSMTNQEYRDLHRIDEHTTAWPEDVSRSTLTTMYQNIQGWQLSCQQSLDSSGDIWWSLPYWHGEYPPIIIHRDHYEFLFSTTQLVAMIGGQLGQYKDPLSNLEYTPHNQNMYETRFGALYEGANDLWNTLGLPWDLADTPHHMKEQKLRIGGGYESLNRLIRSMGADGPKSWDIVWKGGNFTPMYDGSLTERHSALIARQAQLTYESQTAWYEDYRYRHHLNAARTHPYAVMANINTNVRTVASRTAVEKLKEEGLLRSEHWDTLGLDHTRIDTIYESEQEYGWPVDKGSRLVESYKVMQRGRSSLASSPSANFSSAGKKRALIHSEKDGEEQIEAAEQVDEDIAMEEHNKSRQQCCSFNDHQHRLLEHVQGKACNSYDESEILQNQQIDSYNELLAKQKGFTSGLSKNGHQYCRKEKCQRQCTFGGGKPVLKDGMGGDKKKD